jgi:heat shock protein HslJ
MSLRAAIFSIALIAGCRTVGTIGSSANLAGPEWRLLEVDGRAAIPANVAARPWLRFARDSMRVSGHLGCNRTAGPYTADDDGALRFGALLSTRMACVDQGMTAQESALGAALIATDHYRIASDTLVLLQGDRIVARFTE